MNDKENKNCKKMYIFCDDYAFQRLRSEGDFAQLWHEAGRPEELLSRRNELPCMRIASQWFDDAHLSAEHIDHTAWYQVWETILESLAESTICYLCVIGQDQHNDLASGGASVTASNTDSASNGRNADVASSSTPIPRPSTLEEFKHRYTEFRKKFEDCARNRASLTKHVFLLVAERELGEEEWHALRELMNPGDAANSDDIRRLDASYVMLRRLESSNQNQSLHSEWLWPIAVSNLLVTLLAERKNSTPDVTTNAWRVCQLSLDLPEQSVNQFQNSLLSKVHQQVWQPPADSSDSDSVHSLFAITIPAALTAEELDDWWRQLASRQRTGPEQWSHGSEQVWKRVHDSPAHLAALTADDHRHSQSDATLTQRAREIRENWLRMVHRGYVFHPDRRPRVHDWPRWCLAVVFVFLVTSLSWWMGSLVGNFRSTSAVVGFLSSSVVVLGVARWVSLSRRDRRDDWEKQYHQACSLEEPIRRDLSRTALCVQTGMRVAGHVRQLLDRLLMIRKLVDDTFRQYHIVPVVPKSDHDGAVPAQQSSSVNLRKIHIDSYRETTTVCCSLRGSQLTSLSARADIRRECDRFVIDERQGFNELWRNYWKENDPNFCGSYDHGTLRQSILRFVDQLVRRSRIFILKCILSAEEPEPYGVWAQEVKKWLAETKFLGGMSVWIPGSHVRSTQPRKPSIYVANHVNGTMIAQATAGALSSPESLPDYVPILPVVGLVLETLPVALDIVEGQLCPVTPPVSA